jgi:hypothetical protein
MNIITKTTLFGTNQVTYTDPVTEKEVTLECDDFTQGIETAHITALYNACIHLYGQYNKYYTDLLKFADIKGKVKHSINESRANLVVALYQLPGYTNLEDLAAHIYENIFPYLATCTIKSDRYFRILQSVANQSLKFSANHQLKSENVNFVKS